MMLVGRISLTLGRGRAKDWVPYLDDFSEGVRSFTGEATASQIDGADGGLVLDSLTQHCIETNA